MGAETFGRGAMARERQPDPGAGDRLEQAGELVRAGSRIGSACGPPPGAKRKAAADETGKSCNDFTTQKQLGPAAINITVGISS